MTRFVRLPPVDRKQAEKLLDVEARDRIPLPMDELGVVRWMADEVMDETKGRPAMVSAARRSAIDLRIDLLQSAGLTLAGLQSDAVALVNFASFEFDDDWSSAPESGAEVEDDLFQRQHDTAIALVDGGAETTTLALVSPHDFWFGTVENAGENLTVVLARAAKLVAADAEQLKRDPSKAAAPAVVWAAVEKRFAEIRARMEPLMAEGHRFLMDRKITETWCVGGCSLTHGWIVGVLRP